MNNIFSLNNNKHIFIYGDCNSHKEYLIHGLLRTYEKKKSLHLLLADPKQIELRNYEGVALFNRICNDLEDFIFHFELSNEMIGKRLIVINEISDYIKDKKNGKKFKEILKNILDGRYMETNIIFVMQPSFLNEIEGIYNHENVIMFDINQ